jgi:hypothetical protein
MSLTAAPVTTSNKPLERAGMNPCADIDAASAGRSAPIRSPHQRRVKLPEGSDGREIRSHRDSGRGSVSQAGSEGGHTAVLESGCNPMGTLLVASARVTRFAV